LTSKLILEQLANNEKETFIIAQNFAKKLKQGDLVAFLGELGSGKTFFIKSICKKLGALSEATSPTFTIINEYFTQSNFFIYHFDFYRIESEGELLNLDLDDFFYNQHICLVEWANKIQKYLPEDRWEVWLDFQTNKPKTRQIKILKHSKK
jgi:tRNA threonylcarbamoyladenosine biosynthesis protein TsaE